jgi:small subunit ribosomal protein S2
VISVPIPGNDDAIRSVGLITKSLADVVREARVAAPVRDASEDTEAETYSTDSGTEGDPDADRRRRRTGGAGGGGARKRRPKPEAIAARLKTDPEPAAEA